MTQQESQQNLYAFAELEYMLNSYFQKNVRGIVDSSFKHLNEKQGQEYIHTLNNLPVAPGMSGIVMHTSLTAQVVKQTGKWNTKHTEYLVDTIHEKLYKDKSATQHDIGMFIVEWKKLAVARLGAATYEKLSKEVGTDLAAYYICHRLDDLAVQRIAKLGAPKSTLEYVLTSGMKESFAGVIAGLPNKESPLDQRVAHIQDESFGKGAKFAGRALGFGIDMLTPGAKVRGVWAGLDIAVRTVSYTHLDGQWKDYDTFEKDLGKSMFGKENAMSILRKSQLGINQSSDGVQILNSEMKKKVFAASVNMTKVKAVYKAVEKSVGGDAERMANIVRDSLVGHKIKINESSQVPGWMLQKDTAWLIRNSAYYAAMALEMKSKGIHTKKIGNRVWSLNEVAQRGYNYSVAGYQKQLAQVKLKVHEAENIVAQQTQGQYQPGKAQGYQTSYVQTNHGNLQIGNSSSVMAQQQQATVSQASQQSTASGNVGQLSGWGKMFDSIGLGGFGAVGKNLGYVLAMLPDMLINMFTGKSRNLKFGDNLLPIGAILMGMFTKNPLLKMLFVGLGGANLLNKAGHEILENRDGVKAKPVRQYRNYGDEILDSRIKDPVMKGNTLIATINGVPSVITINSADTVDAYYKGKLPLNTLANAVLRKYDEQQQTVQENFDRQVAADERIEVSRSLK